MKNISRHDDIIEFSDDKESLIMFLSLGSITWYYDNKEGKNEMLVTKEDYILFNALRNLYNRMKNEEVQIKPKMVDIGENIKIACTRAIGGPSNKMIIKKVDEDSFLLTFLFRNSYQSIEINVDTYNLVNKDPNYAPYDLMMVDMFKNIYNMGDSYQINFEETEYSLRRKKN